MSKIYTVEGNTSAGSTLVANGGCVAKKSYESTYPRIAKIWKPKYKKGEAEKVCKVALKYKGYLEKKSEKLLESFTSNAGYNNYTRFALYCRKKTNSGIYVNGVAWCDMFVDAIFIEALGVERAKELLGGWSAYTPTSSEYLKKAKATLIKDYSDVPCGCVIFFKNSERICHTGITVNGVKENGTLSEPAKTSYSQKQFVKDVCKILNVETPKEALAKTKTLSKENNRHDALVLPVQKYLKSLGYYKGVCDKDFYTATESAVNLYQEKVLKYKTTDGEITAKSKMWKTMLGL